LRANSVSTSAQVKGTGPKQRVLKEDVQQYVKTAAGTTAIHGWRSGLDLLPWPEVDFAKFGPVETTAAVAHQANSPAPTSHATG
jgi:pyruvate/2-oxoglutarate dehydrogenase complex dihydrolipoamide acyltransferase (E2) component